MRVDFIGTNAVAYALISDTQDSPDEWRHVHVSGTANDETNARTLAEEIKQILTRGRDTHWRVPFECEPYAEGEGGGHVEEWRLFARFSFR